MVAALYFPSIFTTFAWLPCVATVSRSNSNRSSLVMADLASPAALQFGQSAPGADVPGMPGLSEQYGSEG
jgi:hypothetical protein